MKKILFLAGLLTCSPLFSFAQESDFQDMPDWSTLMQDPTTNFDSLCTAFDAYWEGREITPGCGYKPFKRWEQLMQSRVKADGTVPNGKDVQKAFKSMAKNKSLGGSWQPLGPILDEVTTRDNIRGVGRMNYVAFHPTDPNIVFAGAPAGGLWRSFDGGNNWTSNTDDLPTLGVSSIAFNPQNPDIIYCGTGDRDAADSPGMGVMKSEDGGETWTFMNEGIETLTVGDLVVDPINPNIIIAATSEGIFRSEDGAVSWSQESTNSMNYKAIEFQPGNSEVVYATGNGRFFRSSNNGESWQYITDGIIQGNRMVIAVTPANPQLVYVLSANTTEFRALYRSTDGGESFEEMSDSPNILSWSADGSQSGGQAWYDLCMVADPFIEDRLYVGGIRMKQSNDGGATWIDIQTNFLHVDQHWLEFSPHTHELFLANDGGMYRYENNAEWKDITDGIVTSQIYKLGQSPFNPNKTLCGFQDNGTSQFTGSVWQRVGGGDGFECIYDEVDQNVRYTSLYYGRVYRTSENYENQQICGLDVLGITEEGAWSSPFLISRYNDNHMFAGLKNVWRTMNIKHPERDSVAWERISFSLGNDNNSNLNNLEQSRANENMLWCSKGSRRLYLTTNALAPVDSVEWIDLSNSLPWLSFPVSTIETHPTDSATLYIGFNNSVYKSIDRGISWEEFSEGLPNAPVNDILYHIGSNEGLYVATDLGVFYKDADMTSFVNFSNGLPIGARATELDIFYGDGIENSRLKASTYGRGLWESDLFDESTFNFPSTASLTFAGEESEVYEPFELQVAFYKNLENIPVNGLTLDDIQVINATIANLQGGPVLFTLEVTPLDFGPVEFFVPGDVILDNAGISNYESDTLQLIYTAAPEPFGPFGPGGVGALEEMSSWLDASFGTFNAQNEAAVEDGERVLTWNDRLGASAGAAQELEEAAPVLRIGDASMNGMPVLEFNGNGEYITIEGVRAATSPSVFTVARGTEVEWNEHGWIASSRGNNGFVLHPWKESSQYSSMVIDDEGNYANGPQQYIGDAGETHLFGFIYDYSEFGQKFFTLYDDQAFSWSGANIGARDPEALINVQLGWDFDERFGEGQIAEHFMYNKRIHTSQRRIISSYLGAKYGRDFGPFKRYAMFDYPYDVAGIGKEGEYDYHADAQGTGIVRVNEPSSLDNGDYLMWGSDNEALAFVSGLFPLESERLARTWAYDETGDCGFVKLTFDLSDIENVPAGIGLIVETTPFFFVGGEPTFTPLVDEGDGIYSVSYDFWNNGVFTIGVQPALSVANLQEMEWSIYPNPSEGMINIEVPLWPSSLQLVMRDALGRTVMSFPLNNTKSVLNTEGMSPGVYTVQLFSEDGVVMKKVMLR